MKSKRSSLPDLKIEKCRKQMAAATAFTLCHGGCASTVTRCEGSELIGRGLFLDSATCRCGLNEARY